MNIMKRLKKIDKKINALDKQLDDNARESAILKQLLNEAQADLNELEERQKPT